MRFRKNKERKKERNKHYQLPLPTIKQTNNPPKKKTPKKTKQTKKQNKNKTNKQTNKKPQPKTKQAFNIGMYLDIYRRLSFKLGMMKQTAKRYNLIPSFKVTLYEKCKTSVFMFSQTSQLNRMKYSM